MKEEPSDTGVVIYSHTHVHTGFTLATVPCSHPQPPHVWARACTHPCPSPESGFPSPLHLFPQERRVLSSVEVVGYGGLTGLGGRRQQLWAGAALIVLTEAQGPERARGGGS